ncbi:MAG: PcfJ-like protein, partial [Prevotella sp.]|nr:PcfJ-like protein [Prevotella sp.]
MKPRTRLEREVLSQSTLLPRITKAQQTWAFRNCIDHFAYRLPKGNTTCMDCGHSWFIEKNTGRCVCPNCGAKLEVRDTRARTARQQQYFSILTTKGKYQVLRMFLLVVGMEKHTNATICTTEIGQYWWSESGHTTVVAKPRTSGIYYDTFSLYSPLAIRRDNEAYKHIACSYIYPKMKTIAILRRNGFENDFHAISPRELIPALLSDSKAETLMKAGQYQL